MEKIVLSTKTIYRYIHAGFLSIKPIDVLKIVRIRKCSKPATKTNKKKLGTSIEEGPKEVNQRTAFGHWEIDLVLGKNSKNEAVVLTL